MSQALIAVRAVYFIAAFQLFGLLVFSLVFAGRPWGMPGPRRIALGLAAVTLVAMAARLPIEACAMSGEQIAKALANGTIGIVLRETRFGHFWLARAALFAAVAVVVAVMGRGRAGRLIAAGAAGIALALTAVTGHAGAMPGPGGLIHLGADMIHLGAGAAWLGGLLPFAAILAGRPEPLAAVAAAARFSLLGTVCVGLILVTGGINTWFLVRTMPALVGTPYGHLLLIKLALFVALVAVAGANRFRLTPLVATDAGRALAALRRNAVIETALGGAILVVVGVLGTLPPAYEMATAGL